MPEVTTTGRYAPQRYRHLPTVVEGIRYDGTLECAKAIAAWGRAQNGGLPFYLEDGDLIAATAQGPHYVPEGWLAVLGVIGEPYTVRPEVEAVAYRPAGDTGYGAYLLPERLDEILAEGDRTADPTKLRELLAAVVASHKAVLNG